MIFAVRCPLPGRAVRLRAAQPVIRAPSDMAAKATRAVAHGPLRVGAAARFTYKTKRAGAQNTIMAQPLRADAVEEGARVFAEVAGELGLRLCVVGPAGGGVEPRFRVGSRAGR
jgi:hypothetical protein